MTHRRDRGRPRAHPAHRRHVELVHAGAARASSRMSASSRKAWRPWPSRTRSSTARTPSRLVVGPGEVRFEDVTFHYGRESGVFERLSLTVRPGEKIGLVGPSGAGKSTLVSLASAPARPRGRAHPDRRAGHRRRDAGYPARRDRRRDAGHLAAPPLDPGQHRLRPALGGRPSRSSRRSSSPMRRFHPAARGPQGPARLRGAGRASGA